MMLRVPFLIGSCLLASSALGQSAFSMYMPGDLGPDLLVDEAALGGSDLNVDNGIAAFAAWELTGLFNPGDDVSLTGIVLPIWANSSPDDATQNTQNGTFSIEIYGLGGGANTEQYGGLAVETLLGTADVEFNLAGTGVFLAGAAFDSPIDFVADSSGFVVRVRSTSAFRLKNGPQPSSARRINLNSGNRVGNDTSQYTNFTIAGTAIPAPATAALLGLGGLAAGSRRR
ncbi:MAG: PEP-CTERM sorting domain-containing protein [Planctomycetota bacterium]